MFFYEGQFCPVCGKHFAESDDIVTCPQCGCPHHRDCWKQEGHCHFTADHGTDRQWALNRNQTAETKRSAAPTVRCPACGGENPEFAEFCGHCGCDLEHDDWSSAPHRETPPHAQQYTPPAGNYSAPYQSPFQSPFQVPLQDPYGGLSRDEEIQGIKVDELVDLIGTNSAYYLPRFKQMSISGSKVSWNGAGFFLPCNWLLYRKNLLLGIPALIIWLVTNAFSQVIAEKLDQAMATGDEAFRTLFLILTLLSLVDLLLRLAVSLFGNYAYMRLILKKARHLREHPTKPHERDFFTSGGVSFALGAVPLILTTLLAYVMLFFLPLA